MSREVLIAPTLFPRGRTSPGRAQSGTPGEQFAQGGQGQAHGFGARGKRFVHAGEIIPVDVVYVRLKQNVRMPGPGRLQRVPVRRAEGRIEDFHDVFGCVRTCSIGPDGDSQHAGAIDSGSNRRGNRRYNAAVGEQAAFVFHGFDQARKGAARADGHFERAAGKYIRRAGVEICGHNRGWNAQLLHSSGAEPFLYKLADAILPPLALLRLMKAEEVANADLPPKIAKVAQGNAVRVSCAKQGPDTGAYDGGDRDVFLLQDFQDTQVRKASGEAAAQGQGDA